MKTSLVIMSIILLSNLACDDSKKQAAVVKSPAPAATNPFTQNDLTFSEEVVPASGNQGDYLITSSGIWLLRGTEAVKVREVDKLTKDVEWVPTVQRTQINAHIDSGSE